MKEYAVKPCSCIAKLNLAKNAKIRYIVIKGIKDFILKAVQGWYF